MPATSTQARDPGPKRPSACAVLPAEPGLAAGRPGDPRRRLRAWIGIDVVVAVLVLVGWFGGDQEVRSLAYRSLATFVVWPMLTAGLLSLATGLTLGLGTKFGLLRYWWVAVKLGINLVLCTLIVLVLQPGMDEVDAYGRELATGDPDPGRVSTLFFPPAVSLTTLALATTLAVVKPGAGSAAV